MSYYLNHKDFLTKNLEGFLVVFFFYEFLFHFEYIFLHYVNQLHAFTEAIQLGFTCTFFGVFQFGLMQIINHDEALTILSRTVDPSDPTTMLEAVRLLAAICLVPPDG